MAHDELISVVVPLYNHERYIQQCLDSLLEQELPNLELLLLDDGSRDGSLDVARSWEARHRSRFVRTLFETQPNAGITRTMDRLFREARGAFVVILASDDTLLPGSISRRLSAMSEPGVTGVFGDAIPIDEAGQVIGTSAIGELGVPADRRALLDRRTLLWELVFRWNVYGSVLMCRRSALVSRDGGSLLNTALFSEDMQLYYRLAGQGGLRFLDEPVARYRIHGASTCRTPENLDRLRRNIHESRRFAAGFMPWLPRWVVRLQAFTYLRWRRGALGILALPLVASAYLALAGARGLYDAVRSVGLGQSRLARPAAPASRDGRS